MPGVKRVASSNLLRLDCCATRLSRVTYIHNPIHQVRFTLQVPSSAATVAVPGELPVPPHCRANAVSSSVMLKGVMEETTAEFGDTVWKYQREKTTVFTGAAKRSEKGRICYFVSLISEKLLAFVLCFVNL